MPDLKELREERGKLVHDARELVDKADNEKRDMTDEENGKYDEMFNKINKLTEKIQREEQLQEAERRAAELKLQKDEDGKKAGSDGAVGDSKKDVRKKPQQTEEYRAAFEKFMAGGRDALNGEEMRALQADSDTAGGFLVMPEMLVNELIKNIDDMVFIRRLSRTFRVPTAASLGVPTLENDPSDPAWTAEIATGNEDSTMSFGKRALYPHPLAKRIKVSNKLLRMVGNAEMTVRERLAYKFGTTQENAFLTGDGSNEPLGVFTASAHGISTSRDVSTGNEQTTPTFDGLIEAKFTLKGQYWMDATWIMHRDVLKVVTKLKDGEGQYIWRESVRAGEPDRLLGLPVLMSEFAPSTLTSGSYVGILGDFSNYWIADALDMQLQRLVELYAETNQVGFIGRMESDGMPVLEEAFVRVKLA